MAKQNNNNGIYRKPTRGFSDKTNKIIGIAFVVMVIISIIVRGFVTGNKQEEPTTASGTITTESTSTETSTDNSTEASTEASTETSTETSTEASTQKETYYSFRNESTLMSHYEKHGGEFDCYNNAYEYEAGASKVVNNPDALHKKEAEDNDDVYYVEATNEFVIVSTDGFIRTYFKPSGGIDYYNRQ